jgi:hypothetical protein
MWGPGVREERRREERRRELREERGHMSCLNIMLAPMMTYVRSKHHDITRATSPKVS